MTTPIQTPDKTITRVHQICALLAEGKTPREIATLLDPTPMTQTAFQGYVASIRDKARYKEISDTYSFYAQKTTAVTSVSSDLTTNLFNDVYPDVLASFKLVTANGDRSPSHLEVHMDVLTDVLQEKYKHYTYSVLHAYVTTVFRSLLRKHRVMSGKRLPQVDRANDRVFANKFTEPFNFDPKRLLD